MRLTASALVVGLSMLSVAAGPDAAQINAKRHLALGGAHLLERQQNDANTIVVSTEVATVTRSTTTVVISSKTTDAVTVTATDGPGTTESPEKTVEVGNAIFFAMPLKANVWCLLRLPT
jgi:hypothetical protein